MIQNYLLLFLFGCIYYIDKEPISPSLLESLLKVYLKQGPITYDSTVYNLRLFGVCINIARPVKYKLKFDYNFPSYPTVDKRLFPLQLKELKTKDLWPSKFKDLKIDIENLEGKQVLAANHKWTELAKFQKEKQVIYDVWNSLTENFSQLKLIAFEILTIFGSIY